MNEGFRAKSQANHFFFAVVLNEEETHDFRSVFGIQVLDP